MTILEFSIHDYNTISLTIIIVSLLTIPFIDIFFTEKIKG